MNFYNLKEWKTPRGKVTELAIDGVTVWKSGVRIGDLPVGSSVFMNVGGVRTEFLVVHQGLPDATLYDESCNGTWLLMKDINEVRAWDSNDNNYANSDIHSYLNSTFLNSFDGSIQFIIKQVKIPYHSGTGNNGSVISGSNGLPAKIFLLGGYEIGVHLSSSVSSTNKPYVPVDGAKLDYFSNDTSRICNYYSSVASKWWTRSAYKYNNTNPISINSTNGKVIFDFTCVNEMGCRPALILPSETMVDENFNVIA